VLLTITTTAERADELGHLLHKHPDSLLERELSAGRAWVFYPEASPSRTTCALLVEVDPVDLVRGHHGFAGTDQYVNDRPYVAGSMTAVALKRCFSTAMAGRAKERPERVDEQWPFEVRVEAIACAGGADAVRRAFEPLGYEVAIEAHALDGEFPEWGPSRILTLTISGHQTLRDLLNHLYVLLPALDRHKHYWIGEDEVAKLVRDAGDWLAGHPAREAIIQGYLGGIRSLTREAVARLADEGAPNDDAGDREEHVEDRVLQRDGARALTLNELRLERVAAALEEAGDGVSVIDLGCGEGRLLALLRPSRRYARIVGMDVSSWALAAAERRLGMGRWGEAERRRVSLFQGSLMYRDERIRGFDAAALVEVIEHVDPERLPTLERVIFGDARPGLVVVTTPNRDYNVAFPDLSTGQWRHPDHRFEWSRAEFASWCCRVGERAGYTWRTDEIGDVSPDHPEAGGPTLIAEFRREGERG